MNLKSIKSKTNKTAQMGLKTLSGKKNTTNVSRKIYQLWASKLKYRFSTKTLNLSAVIIEVYNWLQADDNEHRLISRDHM